MICYMKVDIEITRCIDITMMKLNKSAKSRDSEYVSFGAHFLEKYDFMRL